MEAYTGFAEVYDLFMDNIPYEEWGTYVKGLLKEYGVDEGLVLELGCGTGTMTEILASAGYDMIGIDQSEEMLEEALEKSRSPAMRFCIFVRICGNLSFMERCGQLSVSAIL